MPRYVGFLARHDGKIVVGAFLLFLAGAAVATRLELRTDLAELLPQNDPALVLLQRIGNVVGNPSTLVIAVEGPDASANRRFADALAARLLPLVGKSLRALDYRADAAKAFYEQNKGLYARQADLTRIADDLEELVLAKKNPAYVALDDPKEDLESLEEELAERARKADRFPSGYYEGEDGRILAMVAWTASSGTIDTSGFRIRDDVRRIVAETNPRAFGDVSAALTGDVIVGIEEHDALKSDVEIISVVCSVLVLAVIIFYFRSLLAVPFIFFPTLLGVAVAFGVTALSIGYLNTNTAFLGSIILGNGINFGIIMLARYREERTLKDAEPALASTLAATVGPTLVAALAASIAYGSLGITRFRGFQQFGFVGGIGMVMCWLATFVHAPALILFVERRRKVRQARTVGSVWSRSAATVFLGRPRLVLLASALVTILAVVSVGRVVARPFDYDLRKLRNQKGASEGAGALYRRVGRIFGSDLDPIGVALLARPEDAPLYRRAVLEKDCAEGERLLGSPLSREPSRLAAECARRVFAGEPTGGLLSDAKTAYGLLPEHQEEKLAVLGRIRDLLVGLPRYELSAKERDLVDRWLPATAVHELSVADLPLVLARPYRELSGQVGRVVLLYPIWDGFHGWDGQVLLRLSALLEGVELPGGARVDAGGQTSVFAAMLRSIVHDGPRTALVAFALVLLLVVAAFRTRTGVVLVVGSLVVGVVWMAGAGAALGLRLNFLNFVAVPVTLGIGVDYAVNVYARLVREPHGAHASALAETGSAVVLCSMTTIIGYSSLLISDNGALRSFGKLAGLGEVGCVAAAILVVPAAMAWRAGRQGGARE